MNPRFSTHLLDEAVERERQERENLRLRLVEEVLSAIDRLSREIPFEEAYLFGSITKPYRYLEGSDVDMGFVGLRDEHFFKAMSFLSREVGVDVDVVQLEGHRLEEKIKREGMKWKGKDKKIATPFGLAMTK